MDVARTFSSEQRKKLASKGQALPDGSFPIVTVQDLKNAIQAYGRASNKAAAKRHIMKRARALGATNLLPDAWKKGDKAMSLLECSHEGCARKFVDEAALHDHAESVHTLSERRSLVAKAVRTVHGKEAFLIDLSDDWLVYDVWSEGQGYTMYRQSYKLDNAGNVTISGDPSEVVRKVTYIPAPKVETAAATLETVGVYFATDHARVPRGTRRAVGDETASVLGSQTTVELNTAAYLAKANKPHAFKAQQDNPSVCAVCNKSKGDRIHNNDGS